MIYIICHIAYDSYDMNEAPYLCWIPFFISKIILEIYMKLWWTDRLIHFCNKFEQKSVISISLSWHWVKAWHPEAFLRSSFAIIVVTFRNDFSYWTISSGLGNLSEIYRGSQWGLISIINVSHGKNYSFFTIYWCLSKGPWNGSVEPRFLVLKRRNSDLLDVLTACMAMKV